ncbi:MAG: Smr/MutS family endonuclease [Gammaproteobacteria bacterium]|nr:Smr/MutS family endonuclease [Gammaproteobacteria bacterium]
MSSKEDKDTESDDQLFRRTVAGTTPLQQDRIMPHRSRPKPLPEQSRADERRVINELLDDAVDLIEIETGDELIFAQSGVQKTVLRRLRRGDYKIQAELDLHGRTVPEAREALIQFLRSSQNNGLRCVRVIHGKGLRSPGKQPVLKSKTDRWLRQRQEILAYCSARQIDGGTGAVYVLLKKPTSSSTKR